jgi:hypothetical protein
MAAPHSIRSSAGDTNQTTTAEKYQIAALLVLGRLAALMVKNPMKIQTAPR